MRKLSIVIGASLILFSCGTEPKTVVMRNKNKASDPQKSSCPGIAPANYHVITLLGLAQPLPAKMAVILDDKMEVNDCVPVPPKKNVPVVMTERLLGKDFRITVDHTERFSSPPLKVSLKVLDLGDCNQTPRELYGNANLGLTFERDYPNGASCKARQIAKASIAASFF